MNANERTAGGIHILGEVFNGDPTYVCPYQEYMSGVLNYPQYVNLSRKRLHPADFVTDIIGLLKLSNQQVEASVTW